MGSTQTIHEAYLKTRNHLQQKVSEIRALKPIQDFFFEPVPFEDTLKAMEDRVIFKIWKPHWDGSRLLVQDYNSNIHNFTIFASAGLITSLANYPAFRYGIEGLALQKLMIKDVIHTKFYNRLFQDTIEGYSEILNPAFKLMYEDWTRRYYIEHTLGVEDEELVLAEILKYRSYITTHLATNIEKTMQAVSDRGDEIPMEMWANYNRYANSPGCGTIPLPDDYHFLPENLHWKFKGGMRRRRLLGRFLRLTAAKFAQHPAMTLFVGKEKLLLQRLKASLPKRLKFRDHNFEQMIEYLQCTDVVMQCVDDTISGLLDTRPGTILKHFYSMSGSAGAIRKKKNRVIQRLKRYGYDDVGAGEVGPGSLRSLRRAGKRLRSGV